MLHFFKTVNYTWIPHHQVWKQKGEEYRLFGGGGWVWTSGLQLRKRKRPGDEKDNFVNKKRKLLDTTNKIAALKEAKRKEVLKQEAEKAARVAAQRASHQTAPVSQAGQTATAATAASAPVQTSATASSSTTQSAPASQALQTTKSSAASAPLQASAATSSFTIRSSTSELVQTTATTTAVTRPLQAGVTVQITAASTSATSTPAASSQLVKTTVTATAVTGPVQMGVAAQTTAASTSVTLTPVASSQTVQATTTAPAATVSAQTLLTVQNTAASTSATLTPAVSSQLVQSITTASDLPAQTSVFSRSEANSTSTTSTQSSVQNVASAHNVANTSASGTPCTVTAATLTGVLSSTFSTLPNVVSQNASPTPTSLPLSLNPSVSGSETTGHPVSTVCASSPIPSTTTLLSGPEVQTSLGTALSTSLLSASNSSETFSSLEKDTSTSSSLVLNTDNSTNTCSTLPSSSATIDIVSTTLPSALSSVSSASMSKCPSRPPGSSAVQKHTSTSSILVINTDNSATLPSSSAKIDIVSTTSSSTMSSVSTASMSNCPYPLPDSSAKLLPSNSTGISLSTGKIENKDHLLEVESKPDTLIGVGRDTVGDDTNALGSYDSCKANVSQSLDILSSTTEVSSDVEKTPMSSLLSCQEHEDQAFASPSSLTDANIKSQSEVFSSSFSEQNSSESAVAQDSSPSDPCLEQNASPCIPLSAEASQVRDLSSKCGQRNEVLQGSSLCSSQDSLVEGDLPDDMKQGNFSSAADWQPRAEQLMTDVSKDSLETITRKNEHELSPGSDYVKQSPVHDKSSPLENHSITSNEEKIPEQHGSLTNLLDVSMTNHSHEDLDHAKENESKGTSSDMEVLESSVVQSKESFLSWDEKKEESEKEFQSSDNNSSVYTQDTQDKVTDEKGLSNDVLPDNRGGLPSLLSEEVSSVGPTEESQKGSELEGNRSIDNSGNKVDISDGGVVPSDSLVNECSSLGYDAHEGKADVAGVEVSMGTRKEDTDDFDKTTLLKDSSSGSDGNVNSDHVSIASNDNLKIDNNGDCKESKSIEQSQSCSLDISRSGNLFNHDEAAPLRDVRATVSTRASEVERTKGCTETSVSVAGESTEFESSVSLRCDSHENFANAISNDRHASETNPKDILMCDGPKAFAENESSNSGESSEMAAHVSSKFKVCQSLDGVGVSESSNSDERPSSTKPASFVHETSPNPAEEPMDVDVITLSSNQSPAGVASTSTEEPMDVDVTTVSSTQTSNAARTSLTSAVLNAESCSQTKMSIEKTSTSAASTGVTGPVLEKTEPKASNENLPEIGMSQPCLAPVLSTVSTASAGGIATTNTANDHGTKLTPPFSANLLSATPAALPTASPSQSQTQSSALAKSAMTTVSQSSSLTASSVAAITVPGTVTVKTTASIGTQPIVSVVPSSAALASPGVAVAGSQGMVVGGSPVVPLAQTILAKSGGSPAVLTAAVTRGIAPQKVGIASRPQSQTTQYVPIGPKPILPSPRTTALSTGLQGSTVRISTQPAASGQSGVAPVSSIAALVASIPTSGTTIGPSQLIRLVTPDGKTLTLQGSQLAALAQQAASPLGLNAPRTITLQVSAAAAQQKPGTSVQKTVGIKTPGAAITVQRQPQQVAQAKTQVVIKPRVETKPLKEEKFPSLEPIIKDPRVLLNRRLAKWPLRHSVKSVFALPRHERRILGRKAGMKEVRGYTYASRAVGVCWPAGIPRPSFKVAWRFRTQSLKTLAGAGLQMRILQSCLKWDEMNVKPPRGNYNTVYTSSGEL